MLCSNRLRIAILNQEIEMWEKRLKDDPDQIPYLGYIRTTMKGRVKELEEEVNVQDLSVEEIEEELPGTTEKDTAIETEMELERILVNFS